MDFNGIVPIKFGEDDTACKLAFKLAEKFEQVVRGRDDYYAPYRPQQGPYLWIATKREAEQFMCEPTCKKVPYALKKAGKDMARDDDILEVAQEKDGSWTKVLSRKIKKTIQKTTEAANPKVLLQLSEEDVASEITYWKSSVFCFILGANPPWNVVEGFIKRVWSKFDIDKVSFMPNGIFLVRFKTVEMKQKVLLSEQLMFDNKPVIVNEWKQDSELVKHDLEYVPIWVKLSGLGLKFWGQTALKKISGLIGEYIRCDDATHQQTLLNFARVLVKVKPDQNYPNSIEFLDEKGKLHRIKVEYDWLPIHCTSCKGMGHLAVNCRKPAPTANTSKPRGPKQVWKPVARNHVPARAHAAASAPVVPSPTTATQAPAPVPTPVPNPPSVFLPESTPSVPFTPARILTRLNSQNYSKDIGPSKATFTDTFSAAVQRSVQMAKGGINSKKVLVARIVEEGFTSRVETRVKSNNWLNIRNNLCSSWALCTNNSLQKNGRVWLLWDPACFDVNVVDITSQTIHSFVMSKVTGRKFWFTVVYGFNHSAGREMLWNKLKDYDRSCHEAWAVGGDFNNVLNYNERIGSDITVAEIAPFQDCVSWFQLQDIPAIGSFFTWNNKQGVDSRVYSRIDRMLVNAEWISIYPEAFANFLPEGLYDHCPCTVQFDSLISRDRAPFKYYNMWSLSSEFEGIVREAWNEHIDGTKMFQVVSKLK
ncbi:uncharacterized protein LOC141651545 [Silene latifolia]|uniref:uncharacterized protein LOC141651545 n=1 Tax=Silene latifolia TaxID=37657 RepID=UPI003D76B510